MRSVLVPICIIINTVLLVGVEVGVDVGLVGDVGVVNISSSQSSLSSFFSLSSCSKEIASVIEIVCLASSRDVGVDDGVGITDVDNDADDVDSINPLCRFCSCKLRIVLLL